MQTVYNWYVVGFFAHWLNIAWYPQLCPPHYSSLCFTLMHLFYCFDDKIFMWYQILFASRTNMFNNRSILYGVAGVSVNKTSSESVNKIL
mgnify:CR=1 FL=1